MGKSLRQVDELISATFKHTYPAMFIHSGLVAAEVTKALSLVTVHAVALHEYVNLSETAAMRARPERFRVQDCPQHGHYYRDVNRVFIRLMFELPALRKFDYRIWLDLDIRVDGAFKVDPFATLHQGGYDFWLHAMLAQLGLQPRPAGLVMHYAAMVNASDRMPLLTTRLHRAYVTTGTWASGGCLCSPRRPTCDSRGRWTTTVASCGIAGTTSTRTRWSLRCFRTLTASWRSHLTCSRSCTSKHALNNGCVAGTWGSKRLRSHIRFVTVISVGRSQTVGAGPANCS
jgi:hypothetical protein